MLNLIKKIGKHSAIFSFSSILSRAIGFLLLPVYTRYLSPTDYGILELLALTLNICGILITQGMPMAFFRNYSFEYSDNNAMKVKAVGTAVFYSIISALVYSSILYVMAENVNQLLFAPKNYNDLLKFISITLFFQCITYVPDALLRARLMSVKIVIANIIHLVVNISLNIYFVVALNLGVNGIIYGNMIAAVLLALIIYGLIASDLSFSFSFVILRGMLSFGLPFVPAFLALFVINGADRFFLQKFSTTEQVGLYALGYKFSILLRFIIIQPFSLIWPSVYLPLAKKADAPETFARFASIYIVVMSSIGLCIILLTKPAIMLMASKTFWDAHLVCIWIVPAVILYGFYDLLNVGINIKKKTKYIPVIISISAAINIVMNYFLVPEYGMIGASISTFLSFFVMTVLAYYLNNKIYPINYRWSFIIKVAVLFIGLLILAIFMDSDSIYMLIKRFCIVLSFFFTGLFILSISDKSGRITIVETANKILFSIKKSSSRLNYGNKKYKRK